MDEFAEELERETSYPHHRRDIERARLLVGVEIARNVQEQFTTATYDSIRNFARSYGDTNPLYTDEEYGTTTCWGGQIAPPMMPVALNAPLLGDPLNPEIKRRTKGLFRGIHVFALMHPRGAGERAARGSARTEASGSSAGASWRRPRPGCAR